MNRPIHPFGAILETLDGAAEANRKRDDRWVARMHAAIDSGAPLFAKSVDEMLERERHKPRPQRPPIRRRFSIMDLEEPEFTRDTDRRNYPNYKWHE